MKLSLKLMQQSQSVKPLAVRRMRIVASPADRTKARCSIHIDGPVPVANFKVNAADTLVARAVQEIVQQPASDAPPLLVRQHGEEKKLRLIRHRSRQREADRTGARRVGRNDQVD